MEVGDQTVHGLEGIAGVDKDFRPLGLCFKAAILVNQGFQGPAGGGAHADHTATGCLGLIQDFGSFRCHHTELCVHMVIRYFLRFYRPEGTKTHVQCDKGSFHTLVPGLVQQFLRPVQSGGGGSGGANSPGIHGLIPLLVHKLFFDVRRQGHLTQAFQHFQEDSLIVKLHHPVAGFLYLNHCGSEFSVTENDLVAHLHFPAGLAQAFPFLIPQVPQQQYLYRTAGGAVTQKPCRKHPGIVHHQAVTGIEAIQYIIKMKVRNLTALPVQLQKPRRIPLLQRGLGDQLFRKFIKKIGGFHTSNPSTT